MAKNMNNKTLKGDLLPKFLRVKGKSKFLFPRLKEEGIKLKGIWNGEITQSAIGKLYNKYESKKS